MRTVREADMRKAQQMLQAFIDNAPASATGMYAKRDGLSYGYRHNRVKAPDNYIWFVDQPSEKALHTPVGSRLIFPDSPNPRVVLNLTPEQAVVLEYITRRIGGTPTGPRGTVNKIKAALESIENLPRELKGQFKFRHDSYIDFRD